MRCILPILQDHYRGVEYDIDYCCGWSCCTPFLRVPLLGNDDDDESCEGQVSHSQYE